VTENEMVRVKVRMMEYSVDGVVVMTVWICAIEGVIERLMRMVWIWMVDDV
jgi:hypothetical protein